MGFPKVELSPHLSAFIEALKLLDETTGGTDVEIKTFITSIEYGFADSIKKKFQSNLDKFRNRPELSKLIQTYLFGEKEKLPWPDLMK